MSMTNDEMRVAIAEAMGWKDMSYSTNWLTLPNGKKRFLNWSEGESWENVVPDYPNDLNAMAEAEKTLTDEQWPVYVMYLYDAAWQAVKDLEPAPWERHESCTAAQRAEAYCRVKGLLKD